jgi:hypothetical protein
VDIYDEPGWFYPVYTTTWPTTQPKRRAVAVKYTCGYSADPKEVDEAARQAIRLLLGHFNENREETIEAALRTIPTGAAALIEQLRYDEFVRYGVPQ